MIEEGRRDALIVAALPNVPFDGWSLAALRDAARGHGVSPAEAAELFPRGAADMVAWFSGWADREMLRAVSARELEAMKVRDRVAAAVEARFLALDGHKEAVRRALAVLALPQNAPLGLKLLYDTVDAIWYAAGDTATDWNFYTKRLLLAGVYSTTMLYWLEDGSPESAETRAFLGRRLDDTARLPRARAALRGLFDRLPNPFRFIELARRR